MLMFSTPLLLLLLCGSTQTLGINIQSTPAINSEGTIQVEAQKTVSLTCAVGSDIQADEELVWLRNGAVVQLNDDNKKGRSSVCITPVLTEDNDAIFTCHLHTNKSDKASITLNVTYAPALSGTEEIKVELESPLVMECDMRANPPVSVSWTLNGSKVDLQEGGFTLTNNGITSRLQVNSVNKHLHEATYKCIAVSAMFPESSQTFEVIVTEKTLNFPLMPIIAGVVVVCATALLAIVSRWRKIRQCFK